MSIIIQPNHLSCVSPKSADEWAKFIGAETNWNVYFMPRRLLELGKRVIALDSIVTHFGFRNCHGSVRPAEVHGGVKQVLQQTASDAESKYSNSVNRQSDGTERRQFPQNYISKCKFNLLFHQVPFLIHSYPDFHANPAGRSRRLAVVHANDVNFNCNKWLECQSVIPARSTPLYKVR